MEEFNTKKENSNNPLLDLQKSLQDKSKISKGVGLQPPSYSDEIMGGGLKPMYEKPSLTKQIPITEGYNLVGDKWIKKFDTFQEGRDNYEYAAQNQSTWDKWSNGLLKAGANLGTTVLGNTVGIVYGGVNAVAEGNFNALSDNSFSNGLADFNEKLSYQLPNYVSKQEREEGFLGSLDNANFWANDVMGGLSFIIGTVVSEAIWALATGGFGNIAKAGLKGAQLGAKSVGWGTKALGLENTVKGISTYKKMLNAFTKNIYTKTDDALKLSDDLAEKVMSNEGLDVIQSSAVSAAKKANWKNTARFLATTSGNEAGIEALHYKREQRENFFDTFEELNGRPPTQEDINKFEENLSNSANAVFATNMAILMPSNLAMFGSLFKINSPFKGLTRSVDKSLFGIGVEKVDDVYKGIQATGRQKAMRWGYALTKPIATEGLWEEGLQGATTKTAENWITSTFDPKYNNETMSLADATYKALAEQYGTKEGWKEIGIGGIIGGGMSIVQGGGKPQEIKEFNEKQKYQDEYIAKGLNKFGDNSPAATQLLVRKMMFDARLKQAAQEQKDAIKTGDDVGAMLAQQKTLIGELQFRKSIGEDTKELVSKYETALNALPKEVWEENGIEDVEGYKKSVIEGYKNVVNQFEKASDFANAVLGETRILGQDIATQQLKDALTYSIVSGQSANRAMDLSLQEMAKIIGDDTIKARRVMDELTRLGTNKQAQVRRLNSNITQAETEYKKLSDELQKLQVSKEEQKGKRLKKVRVKLIESNDKLSVLKQDREDLAKELSQESSRRKAISSVNIDETSLVGDFITGEDLANIEEKLQKIQDAVKSYEGVNHEIYFDLLESQKNYKSAKQKFLDYQASIDAIVSGNFKPNFEKMGGLLGKIFNSKEPLNDFTSEFLKDVYTKYFDSVGSTAVEVQTDGGKQYVTEEEYTNFKENGEVSQELKQKIAEKVKQKNDLSEREKEIYNFFTKEINALTKPNPNKPDLSPESLKEKQILELENEKRKLEEQLASTPETITTSDIEAKKADIKIGKVGNTEYEVKSDGVYFKGIKLDNTENKTHRQLIEADIERRKQKEKSDRAEVSIGGLAPTVISDPNNKFFGFAQDKIKPLVLKAVKSVSNLVEEWFNNKTINNQKSEDISTARDLIQLLNANPILKYFNNNVVEKIRKFLENKEKGIEERTLEEFLTDSIDKINTKYDAELNALEEGITEQGSKETLNPTYEELRKEISKINKKIDSLKTEDKDLSEAQKLRKRIEKSFEKYYPLLTTDIDELIKDKPTQDEIERYLELYSKKDKFDLFEQKEFEELQPRMQKWFMAQSLPVGGLSIADLAELISQLETQIDKEETLTEVKAEDLVATIEESEARAINRVDILQNVAGSAVGKIKDGNIFLIHIDTKKLLNSLINVGASIMEVRIPNKNGKLGNPEVLQMKHINKHYKAEGTEFTIGNAKITIGKRGNIIMPLSSFTDKVVSNIAKLSFHDANVGKWSYFDLYEELPNGTKIKKQSEYTTNTDSDSIYDVEQGDDLKPFVDLTTDFNKELIDEAFKDLGDGVTLSEEMKQEIRNSLEITTKSYNEESNSFKNNSTMKASSKESVDDNFLLIRKRFADELISEIENGGVATLPKKIELDIEFPVSEIFLGTPEFILDSNNKPIDFEITERGLENVITQGYVQGDEIVLADKKIDTKEVSRLFVSNTVKANPSAKIPVVLLQKGKHKFVFPISLNKSNESQVVKLDSILAKDLSPIEEVKAINNLLISLGSNTRLSGLSDIAIEDIRQELENYTTFVSADTLASVEYDKTNLMSDATVKINLEDRLISSPKITVDYSKAIIGTKDQNETDAIKLREDIIAVDIIGRDRLVKIREKLELLEFYENQIRIIKDKQTSKKLNCN